jgi:GTPase involved in cell partitioning and DNA repair
LIQTLLKYKKLKLEDEGLASKEEIIILTKSDVVEDKKIIDKKKKDFAKVSKKVALLADRVSYMQENITVEKAVELAEKGEDPEFYFYTDGNIGLAKIKQIATYIGKGLSL